MDLMESFYKSCYVGNKKKDNECADGPNLSFKLIDALGNILVDTPNEFCHDLLCMKDEKMKVVSIFGNPGEGKSETLNKVFFNGMGVFQASDKQSFGVHAAKSYQHGVICLDTKGLSGELSTRRTEMLIKVLAMSDIIIYRTCSEGSHNEMFNFLDTASKAYTVYLSKVFQSFGISGSAKQRGPDVIIFHETQLTKPTEIDFGEYCEDVNAFHTIGYVASQKNTNNQNIFIKLEQVIDWKVKNNSIRSARSPSVVFKLLQSLHLHFSTKDSCRKPIIWFPEQYFSCPEDCKSCGQLCQNYMGHISDGVDHKISDVCEYKERFDNKAALCKRCFNEGKQVKVKFLAGLIPYASDRIECRYCGEIHRTWKYWSGNKSPDEEAIRYEAVHVWKEDLVAAKPNIAQEVVNSASYIGGAFSNNLAYAFKVVSDTVSDNVAPRYWKPNHTITNCKICKRDFEKTGLYKHHCRGCGEGFCHRCSQHKASVPGRGWTYPVRVCNDCYSGLLMGQKDLVSDPTPTNITDIRMRQLSENVYNTVTCVTMLAKETIKDSARPSYWVPDAEARHCEICKARFGTIEELEIIKANLHFQNVARTESNPESCKRHHCRRCGQAVCEACSKARLCVPERGWENKVRVCDACAQPNSY